MMGFYTIGTEDNAFLWLVQEKLSGGLRKNVDRSNGVVRVVRRSCGGQATVERQGRDVVTRLGVAGPMNSILNSSFPVTYLRFPGSPLFKRQF